MIDLKVLFKIMKKAVIVGGSGIFVSYHVCQTYRSLNKIVNHNVLDTEKRHTVEYIYIDDPTYGVNLEKERSKETQQSLGFSRIWKSLKHSLAWRLLWLCRHGSKEQRDVALVQLASFKNNKMWDCVKLAQALDKNSAVLLARTRGADIRYFLPPPAHIRRAALCPHLLSFHFRDMIVSVQNINPHSCIQHFLSKYFANVQEQAMEADTIPIKPDHLSERELCLQCLDAILHHLRMFHNKSYEEDNSAKALINMGLLPKLAELWLRNPNDVEIDVAIVGILIVLSVFKNLLTDFYQNGLIKELVRLIKSNDVRLSSSAAVCLTNLSGEGYYRPGLYLLHPIYRSTKPYLCDTLLIHGLRGGVFVTWRQRDRKCLEPLGIKEVTSDKDCETCEKNSENGYIDPELKQVMEELIEIDDDALLADFEVALHDIPVTALRESRDVQSYTAKKKRTGLIQEEQDKCNYTYCWPKDWLPSDCSNLRILGVNYWSSLSEWLESCPLQAADIESRALELLPALIDADVGKKNIPVIWLAHSMGGLIAKQVLIEAARSHELVNKLCDNTKAIFFYSTPHKGSAFAKMPRAAAAVLWPSNDVRQLQENSPELLQIQNSFINLADNYHWKTISFVETKPTLVTAFKVPIRFVESFSADLGRGELFELPLDHLSICKPATRQSILYTTVLEVLHKNLYNDIEYKYSNPLIRWAMKQVGSLKNYGKIQSIEENNNLCWFEQLLLDTFTDDFI